MTPNQKLVELTKKLIEIRLKLFNSFHGPKV